jgi:hypothetical protein
MVNAVRAATFLAEEEITYQDEFGPNDHVATHILLLVDGDPAGVIRIRWFASFAILERIGIRKRYRSYPAFARLAKAALELVKAKGYSTVVGRARGDTNKLWARFLDAKPSGPKIHMHRGTLTPMIAHLTPEEGCSLRHLSFGQPEIEELIVQPEGSWNMGLLTQSRTQAA